MEVWKPHFPGRLSIAGSREKLLLIASLLLCYMEPHTYVSTGKSGDEDTEKRDDRNTTYKPEWLLAENADPPCPLCHD